MIFDNARFNGSAITQHFISPKSFSAFESFMKEGTCFAIRKSEYCAVERGIISFNGRYYYHDGYYLFWLTNDERRRVLKEIIIRSEPRSKKMRQQS